jgi:hypothetical protein
MRRRRVVSCLAEVTQQIHSFRASGVKLFQVIYVAASWRRASLISLGILCAGPSLLTFFTITLVAYTNNSTLPEVSEGVGSLTLADADKSHTWWLLLLVGCRCVLEEEGAGRGGEDSDFVHFDAF